MPQHMRILVPPSMTNLWDDPLYRAYMERRPKLPDNLKHGTPWMLVAHRKPHEDGPPWGHRLFTDYFEALDYGLELLDDAYDDISVVCRPKMFKPALNFTWEPRFTWCGRCRRPTLFRKPPRNGRPHHALRNARAIITDTTEDLHRCYYCGARRAAQPNYRERFS